MSQDVFVFEVGESGFDRYVIENSRKLPVLVEFMAIWSEPCVLMAETIHDLAVEFAGMFVFAKVDIDEQPGLRDQYSIKNVPSLVVIKDGEVAFMQEGQLQEDELRVLLRGLGVFRKSDEMREQARSKHVAGDTLGAIMLLTEAIRQDPGNTRVAMDMVQIFLDIGELDQARGLFNRLPDRDKESDMGKSLIGQLVFADLAARTEGMDSLKARLADNANDHDARFDLAVCLVSIHDLAGAMEQLFIILQAEPGYREGAARELIITLANMLAPNDPAQARAYRQRLANMAS